MTKLYKKNGTVFVPVGFTLEEVEKLIKSAIEHKNEQKKKETNLNSDYFYGQGVKMIDLNKLAKQAYITAYQRNLNGAKINPDSVMDMLKHCASEVIEAAEAYTRSQWQLNKNEEEIELEHFSLELADIITCCLIITGKENIDIEVALNRVMEKNKKRAEKQGDKL